MSLKSLPLAISLFFFLAGWETSAQSRFSEIQACYETTQPKAKIALWDNAIEDHDTVTIYLNGKAVLNKVALKKEKQYYDIDINPGYNEFALYAENLGEIPDNTASIEIVGATSNNQKSLSSSLKKTGVMLLYGKFGAAQYIPMDCPVKEKKEYNDNESFQARGFITQFPDPSLFQFEGEAVREIDLQECSNVSFRKIKVELWDAGKEDNDTISLNVNGVWVVKRLRLASYKQIFEIDLQPGENWIVLHAHNLGDIPPNTSAINLDLGFSNGEKHSLTSDYRKSGLLRIYVPGAPVAHSPCVNPNKTIDEDPEITLERTLQAANLPSNYRSSQPQNRGTYSPTYDQQGYHWVNWVIPVLVSSGGYWGTSSSPAPNTGSRNGTTRGGNTGTKKPESKGGRTKGKGGSGKGRNDKPINY